MKDPTAVPQWEVGFFGKDSKAPTQDLSALVLSDAERQILAELQEQYKWYKMYTQQGQGADWISYGKNVLLPQLRGLKRALELVQTTNDGFDQQDEWQGLLY